MIYLLTLNGKEHRAKVEHWRRRLAELQRAARRVVVWGAGSKGITFAPDIANDGDLLCGGNSPSNCSDTRLDQFTAFLFPADPPVSEEVLAKFPGQLRGPFEIELTR